MSGDISRYLVSVEAKPHSYPKTKEERISYALKSLFGVKKDKYGPKKLGNSLFASNLDVLEVTTSDEVTNINLGGKIVSVGSLNDAFIKKQIEKTVEKYTSNYEIRLNNSESEWRCALDKSGTCQ